MKPAVLAALAGLILVLCGCGNSSVGKQDPAQVDATDVPAVDVCRNLTRVEMSAPSNASPLVACTAPHNSQTFGVGELPDEFTSVAWNDAKRDTWAYGTCSRALASYLGADDSALMRSLFSWRSFGPSEKAWSKGARWWRCDLVAGGDKGQQFLDLPTSTLGLLADTKGTQDDQWMACARGESVNVGTKVACNQPHNWRAVTTIKVGEPGDSWPGQDAVVAKTKQFCSSSVAAWMGYPDDYSYGYTWFGEPEWKAGNRHSVCWAKTAE